VSAPGIPYRIDFSGDFFRRDSKKTFRQNITALMAGLAEAGEADVKAQMLGRAGRMPNWTGRTRDAVRGRTSAHSGRRWQVTAVVSIPNTGSRAEAIRVQASGHSIERRFRPFKNTTYRIRREKRRFEGELLRGIK
jgi:hypothetical protein